MDIYEKYVGQVFDRRYRINKVIGIGGMAVVFEAQDLLMRRNVAVKMLKDEINNDTQSVKRFINESKAVAMLSHPNIVNIYDVSVKENLKYIVMELVEGITLKNYIQKKGVLPLGEIVSITEQILLALDHAHQKGIVHRDIKPQNIMMLKSGAIKVADFGIAKLPNAETLTMTDKAIGTVFYISPEQASGKPIDRRSDIYALGVTMYEMATGKLPFTADSPVTVAIMQVKNRPRPPRELNASIPLGLEQIILNAMEKSADNRFQSAAQMLRHLAQIKNNPRTVFKMPKADAADQSLVGYEENLPSNVKKLKAPKRANRSMFPVIAGVASAFLIVCIISAAVVFSKLFEITTTDPSRSITVPKFVDTIYSEGLEQQLESTYYNVEVKYIYDAEYDRNVIISQEPGEGEKRKVNPSKGQKCELILTVCWGAETVDLEDFAYDDARDAMIELRNMGLLPVEIREQHEYISEGYVIRTDPEPGTTMKVGDTVTLYVSSGQELEYIEAPKFEGCTEAQIMSMLEEYKLNLGSVTGEYSETVPEGCCISQKRATGEVIPVGAQIPVGTKISFVMSLGPKPADTTADTDVQDPSGDGEPAVEDMGGVE